MLPRPHLLLILLITLLLLQPAPHRVILGDPQIVETTLPLLGIHTRLTDEVEEWKIKQSLQLVREMGAPWIVELFPWAYYEPQQGQFDWDHADMVIDHAEAQGLQVIARIGLTPQWARPPDTALNYLDQAHYSDYANFAAAFAKRYRGRVEHIIILNEPNLSFEWGGQVTTAADYVDLLRVVYPAVKAANPEVVVLAGALAPTLEAAGSPNGVNDLVYLREMLAADSAEYFDALAVHSYGLTFPPTAEPAPDILNFRRVELLREILLEAGVDKPFYITESGWNDHPRWTRAVKPAQRIAYTLEAIEYAQENWPYVEVLGLWMLRTPAPSKNFLDYYTFITPEFVQKPIYTAVKKLARGEMR